MDYFTKFFENLSGKFGNSLPMFIGAFLMLFIGWMVAKLIKRLVKKLINGTQIDEKFNKSMSTKINFANTLGSLAYYVVMVYVIVLVLDMLGMESVLTPLENMINTFIGYIPNIVGAGLICVLGYLIATLASEAVGFIASGTEKLSRNIGLDPSVDLTKILRQIVFIFVFVPILIVALDTLGIDAISVPAIDMLNTLLNMIPKIIGAVVVLAVFYFVGKYFVRVVVELLKNLGVDNLMESMQMGKVMGNRSLSRLIGDVLFFFFMFLGLISATEIFGFNELTMILMNIMIIVGNIVFGLIIIVLGNFISIQASQLIGGEDSKVIRRIVRIAILMIFFAMALSTMGIAPGIVELAFGLTLGAIAVAFALSFGLGGREAAGKYMEDFFNNLRK